MLQMPQQPQMLTRYQRHYSRTPAASRCAVLLTNSGAYSRRYDWGTRGRSHSQTDGTLPDSGTKGFAIAGTGEDGKALTETMYLWQ